MGVPQRQSGPVPGCDGTGSVLLSSRPPAPPEPGGWDRWDMGWNGLREGEEMQMGEKELTTLSLPKQIRTLTDVTSSHLLGSTEK